MKTYKFKDGQIDISETESENNTLIGNTAHDVYHTANKLARKHNVDSKAMLLVYAEEFNKVYQRI